jgi:TonB family protein
MSDSNKNKKDSFSEFLRYQEGKMSGDERNSFERELQKDAFAEEASEGFASIKAEELKADLNNLEKKVKSGTANKRRYIYYSIAASVAVLMVISTLYIIINRSNTSSQLAVVTVTEKADSIKEEQPLPVLAENKNTIEKEVITNNNKSTEEKKQLTLADATQGAGAAEKATDEEPPVYDKVSELKLNNINASVAEMQAAAPMAARAMDTKAASQLEMKTDSDLYSLDEIVVVGYGAKKFDNENHNTPAGYIPPQPSGGRSAFDKYIEENINRPDTITKGQRVVVVINFTVLLNGNIDSLKIVRSPGKPFSDEAIRLLKSGPKWKPAEENGQAIADEVKIRIVFR